MNKEEITYKKLKVSAILFKNNVPIEDAKYIGVFIEELEQENKRLEEENERLKLLVGEFNS